MNCYYLSIINILNFILSFVYDKHKENKLKNILGLSPRVINASLVMQVGLIALIGMATGFISTIMFTIPYINANYTSVSIVASPLTFCLICLGVLLVSMIFSLLILKARSITKTK